MKYTKTQGYNAGNKTRKHPTRGFKIGSQRGTKKVVQVHYCKARLKTRNKDIKIGFINNWQNLYILHKFSWLQCWKKNQETSNQVLRDWVKERQEDDGGDTIPMHRLFERILRIHLTMGTPMGKMAQYLSNTQRVVTTMLGKQEPRNTQPGTPGLGERESQEEGGADTLL